MLVHGTYGIPHSIKLRHVHRDRQAARMLLRQLLQGIIAASEQGDLRAAIRQSNRRRQPDSRRSARDNEYVILDLHRFISLT
jgi:hypothetical protein